MSHNGTTEAGCITLGSSSNSTCIRGEVSVTSSVISMTVGILSNTLALVILVKAYRRFRLRSKASFLLFASGLVVTDCLGHLINGSLVLYVYGSNKDWEAFDPRQVLCAVFGVSMVFFGLSPLLLGSVMAMERCIGVTRPLFHSTVLSSYHTKRLLGLTWLLAIVMALLPILLGRPYQVQPSQSWCFFRMVGTRDWLDVLLPLIFSTLGLLALLISIVCNTMTGFALLHSAIRSNWDCHHHRKGTSHHFEMICQVLAITLVSCVCWGPFLVNVIILSTRDQGQDEYTHMLLAVRMATWNQILDPWVYILLRKAVLRRLFLVTHRCCRPRLQTFHRWKCSTLKGSMETGTSFSSRPDWICLDCRALPDTVIKHIP